MNRKKRFCILMGLAVLAIMAGIYCWNASQSVQQAQTNGEAAVVSKEHAQPSLQEAQENEQKAAAAETQALPAQDTLAMTFEGTKTYIVAGSISGTKNGACWKAEIRNGKEGKISQVEFKQDGQKLMTRNDGGPWRPMDEMDRTLFHKLMEVLEKQ